jgi:hypothetical protein
VTGFYIPKVLRGCRFAGFEQTQRTTQIIFISDSPLLEGGVVRVSVSFKGPPQFIYSIYDPESETIVHYEGPHGDPDLDPAEEVKGTND